jgi:hypothetical protein
MNTAMIHDAITVRKSLPSWGREQPSGMASGRLHAINRGVAHAPVHPHGERRPAKNAGRIHGGVPGARAGKVLNRRGFTVPLTLCATL